MSLTLSSYLLQHFLISWLASRYCGSLSNSVSRFASSNPYSTKLEAFK